MDEQIILCSLWEKPSWHIKVWLYILSVSRTEEIFLSNKLIYKGCYFTKREVPEFKNVHKVIEFLKAKKYIKTRKGTRQGIQGFYLTLDTVGLQWKSKTEKRDTKGDSDSASIVTKRSNNTTYYYQESREIRLCLFFQEKTVLDKRELVWHGCKEKTMLNKMQPLAKVFHTLLNDYSEREIKLGLNWGWHVSKSSYHKTVKANEIKARIKSMISNGRDYEKKLKSGEPLNGEIKKFMTKADKLNQDYLESIQGEDDSSSIKNIN